MKVNDGFRRFNHRSEDKVTIEVMLYIFGKNIDKYHKFKAGKIRFFTGKNEAAA